MDDRRIIMPDGLDDTAVSNVLTSYRSKLHVGKPDGPVTSYHADGSIAAHMNYQMGKKQGMFRYYEDGLLSKIECWDNNYLDTRLSGKMNRCRRWLARGSFALMQFGELGSLLCGVDLLDPEVHLAWRENILTRYYNKMTTRFDDAKRGRARPAGLGNVAIASTATPDGKVKLAARP